MIITGFEIIRKTNQFNKKFVSAVFNSDEKEYLELKLFTDTGIYAAGEVTELISHSTEKLSDSEFIINSKSSHIIGYEIKNILLENEDFFNQFKKYPATRCAFEQAVLNLLLKTGYKYFDILNSIKIDTKIKLNAVTAITKDISNLINEVQLFEKEGYEVVKLKCGLFGFNNEIKIINELINSTDKIKFRFDANGRWAYRLIEDHLNILSNPRIEFLEQPESCVDENILISNELNIPVAIDESYTLIEDMKFAVKSGIKYLVLKPAVIGGILNTFNFIDEQKKYNYKVVISSALESSLGFQVPAFLAGFCNNEIAHGLSTINLISENCDTINGYLDTTNLTGV